MRRISVSREIRYVNIIILKVFPVFQFIVLQWKNWGEFGSPLVILNIEYPWFFFEMVFPFLYLSLCRLLWRGHRIPFSFFLSTLSVKHLLPWKTDEVFILHLTSIYFNWILDFHFLTLLTFRVKYQYLSYFDLSIFKLLS